MPRVDRQGGGVMYFYKNELKVEKINPPFPIKTMEFMEVMLTVWSKKLCLVTIYHPEVSQKNKYTMEDFYKEFSKFMTYYNIIKDEVIICGDINIHVNKPDDPNTRIFMDILSQFNLVQHINEQTHKLGNTLDYYKKNIYFT